MAKCIFAGGELDSVDVINGTVSESTTAGWFDSSYARCALLCNSSSDRFRGRFINASQDYVSVVTGETLYWHGSWRPGEPDASGENLVELQNSSDHPWAALRANASGVIGFFYNSNTGASPTWTQIGSSISHVKGELATWDIKLTLGSPHQIEVSKNGTLVISGSFTQASLTALDRFVCRGKSFGVRFSQIMATEGLSTIGGNVRTRAATADGTTTDWVGTYTDVNETTLSDATSLVAASAGLVFTHVTEDVTLPANMRIASVFVNTRIKHDGVAPTNFQAACRRSGTDYFTADVEAVGTSFGARLAQFSVDPSTAAEWNEAGFNAAEFGGKSIT